MKTIESENLRSLNETSSYARAGCRCIPNLIRSLIAFRRCIWPTFTYCTYTCRRDDDGLIKSQWLRSKNSLFSTCKMKTPLRDGFVRLYVISWDRIVKKRTRAPPPTLSSTAGQYVYVIHPWFFLFFNRYKHDWLRDTNETTFPKKPTLTSPEKKVFSARRLYKPFLYSNVRSHETLVDRNWKCTKTYFCK